VADIREAFAKRAEPEGRLRALDDDGRARLIAALPERVRRMVVVAVLTGLRRADLCDLRKSDVDLAADVIVRVQGKTVRRVAVPLHPLALDALRDAVAQGARGCRARVHVAPRHAVHARRRDGHFPPCVHRRQRA